MNQEEFRLRVERLREANAVVESLDPAIRANAFALLEPYVTGEGEAAPLPVSRSAKSRGRRRARTFAPEPVIKLEDENALIEKHLNDADHENAMLALAIFYKRHGRGPFALSQIKTIADTYELEIPQRLDKFFLSAKRGEPKTIVARKQSDGWKIMSSGESWMKQTYGVTMGGRPWLHPPAQDSEMRGA